MEIHNNESESPIKKKKKNPSQEISFSLEIGEKRNLQGDALMSIEVANKLLDLLFYSYGGIRQYHMYEYNWYGQCKMPVKKKKKEGQWITAGLLQKLRSQGLNFNGDINAITFMIHLNGDSSHMIWPVSTSNWGSFGG